MGRKSLRHVEMILIAAMAGFAGGLYWTTRALAPPVQLVNGIYHNVCCAAVELKDGFLVAGSARIDFKLENMKFGLTAYPVTPLEVDGGASLLDPALLRVRFLLMRT